MTAVALHKGNVYWELSGWAPKYFPPSLRTDIRGRLREKMMFGSDHPSLPYERILREWDELGYDQSVHGPGLPRQRRTGPGALSAMATLDDMRGIAMSLPRTSEHLIRDQSSCASGGWSTPRSRRTRSGWGSASPGRNGPRWSPPAETFMMPLPSDERYQWVRARLSALDVGGLRELLVDAWCMCVPKKVAAAYLEGRHASRGVSSSRSTTTGAWSDGPLPLRSSRST